MPGSQGHTFCPAKLFRDDPETVRFFQRLLVSWQLGQVPDGGTVDTMDEETLTLLGAIITQWEQMTFLRNMKTLSHILGGGPKK